MILALIDILVYNKQICTKPKKDVKVAKLPITFDPYKRFATLIPIISMNGKVPGSFVIMGGSPSKKEMKKYPYRIGYDCNTRKYLNEIAWIKLAIYYKKVSGRNRRVCYNDNFGVHVKHAKEFESKSTNAVRFLIANATSKHQPVDQDVGVYCQNFIKRRFYLMERNYNNKLRNGIVMKKKGLGDMRLWLMCILNELLTDLKTNRKQLMKHSWKNTGLLLKIDGSEDEADKARFYN